MSAISNATGGMLTISKYGMSSLSSFEAHLAASGVSEARRRYLLRFLRDLADIIGGRSLTDANGADLGAMLARRSEQGYAPNTLRKERYMALSYFNWAYQAGHISADVLPLRAVKSPAASTGSARPVPYSSKELRKLRETLDTRWPKLSVPEATKRVTRWREGVTPYRRIRTHAIRLQLNAVVALCLHGGLRRGELRASR